MSIVWVVKVGCRVRQIQRFVFSLAFGVICLSHSPGASAEIYLAYPETVDIGQNYVFYLHGKIVEGADTRPEHPRWGTYDFPAVVDALTTDSYHLIAVHRSAGKNSIEHATELAAKIRSYQDQGLDPTQMTIIGFSKGGAIAILAMNTLKQENLTTILLAACADWTHDAADILAYGKLYSIFEKSDRVGSCAPIQKRSELLVEFKEIEIDTGFEHGAFYQPLQDWVVPVKKWILGDS